ncbi:MAG: type I restriction endonuclease subunit R [Leptolyngbyaceae bacterium]|nr:type I restriction endonuclease subunit R [Leptolyngbyaceae bacterium]
MTTTAITKAITSLRDVRDRFNVTQTQAANFFAEWQFPLPDLSPSEQQTLAHLQHRYLYYLEQGDISEGTVNIIMVSPLLNALGLCDPPYRIRGEKWVEITVETDTDDGTEILNGRMDAVVLQDHLWLVVVEGKRGGFNIFQALPQTLTYMMASPSPNQPVFGLVTNGYDYLFIKLLCGTHPQYALSHNFTLLSDEANNLTRVAQILKRLVVPS